MCNALVTEILHVQAGRCCSCCARGHGPVVFLALFRLSSFYLPDVLQLARHVIQRCGLKPSLWLLLLLA